MNAGGDTYRPMKAVTGTLPAGEGWGFEIKWDGMRALVTNSPDGVTALSSRGNDITARFPELQRLRETLGDTDTVLDGELVALGDDGLPSFGRLQSRMHLDRTHDIERRAVEVPVVLMVFDLLRLDGNETLPLALRDRHQLLEALLENGPTWQLSVLHEDGGTELLEVVRSRGMEGVVAKKLDSPYVPGERSANWVKVKARRRQEFVVGGWLSGEGGRSGGIGALLVGYQADSGLRSAGRVGSGLSETEITRLVEVLQPLARPTSPFVDAVAAVRGRRIHWVEPTVVVEVEFGEWTADANLRHPVYLGRRVDADPERVVREPDPDLPGDAAPGGAA